MSFKDKIAAFIPRGDGIGAKAGAARLARFVTPQSNEHHEKRDAMLFGVALGTFALGALSIYLPLTGCLAMLVIFLGCRMMSKRYNFHVTTISVVSYLVSLYITLIQPAIGMFIGPVLVSAFATWVYHRRVASKTFVNYHWVRRLSTLGMVLVGLLPSFFVYDWIYTVGIPAVHPFTVSFWNVSPCVYVIAATLLSFYCVSRLGASKSLVYRLAPGFSVLGFALLYPMHESVAGSFIDQYTAGDAVEWLFVLSTFALAFTRPSLMRFGGSVVGAAFCLMFAVFQLSNWAYLSAVGLSMPVQYIATAPTTVNSRTMPLVVGESSCPQGNTTPKTTTGPVSIALSGSHFDFQCALHYTSWIGTDPILSLIPGSTLDVIRVDAGTKSGEVREVHGRFYFGEASAYYRAAVLARHPGATVGDYNYTEDADGKNLELAISYSQKRLFWGAMVPALGGSVVESQSGGFEDYSVADAAKAFPDFFQVPEDIVKLRAKAWAGYRNPMASAWSPDEISQTDVNANGGDQNMPGNRPPFGLALESGPAWFIGLEPAGINGTAMSYFMFFDARYGVARILDVSQASPKLKGLRDMQHLAPSVVTGNNGLYGIEPIPVITADGSCFYSVSVMGPHTEMRNRDFQGVAIFTCSGDKVSNSVLDSTDKVNDAIASWGSAVKIGKPSSPAAVLPAAAAPSVAPVAPAVGPAPLAVPAPVAPTDGLNNKP